MKVAEPRYMRLCAPRLFAFLKRLKRVVKLIRFKLGGRVPWSDGYFYFKWQAIEHVLSNPTLLETFARAELLPSLYGIGIDERIVEYPWMLARLKARGGVVLDAGSITNFEVILDQPQLAANKVHIVTLAPEATSFPKKAAYLYEDIRNLPFKDNYFDGIVCISTLEHIGMDNASLYTDNAAYRESEGDFAPALMELKRVLKPGGQLLITVPFGAYEDHGFFQQFDASMVAKIQEILGSTQSSATYYKYGQGGWQASTKDACANEEYFDVRKSESPAPDKAAAARAVACLEYTK